MLLCAEHRLVYAHLSCSGSQRLRLKTAKDGPHPWFVLEPSFVSQVPSLHLTFFAVYWLLFCSIKASLVKIYLLKAHPNPNTSNMISNFMVLINTRGRKSTLKSLFAYLNLVFLMWSLYSLSFASGILVNGLLMELLIELWVFLLPVPLWEGRVLCVLIGFVGITFRFVIWHYN
jgi:hypothetical protein